MVNSEGIMDDLPPIDWTKPPPLEGRRRKKRDHTMYESLEEGIIPTPIPHRVKSGNVGRKTLHLNIGKGSVDIAWENIELIALGVIQEELVSKEPKSRIRRFLRKYFFGESERVDRKRVYREFYLLDIYVKEEEAPYRIDQTTVNYREFLSSVGYVSLENFRILVKSIVSRSSNASLDPSLVAFLTRSKQEMRKYPTIYDFELQCQYYRENINKLIPQSKVDIKKRKIKED